METQEILKKRSLFWDVGKLDVEKNARFIMERILNFGDVEDFRWARDIYGSDKLKESFAGRGIFMEATSLRKVCYPAGRSMIGLCFFGVTILS